MAATEMDEENEDNSGATVQQQLQRGMATTAAAYEQMEKEMMLFNEKKENWSVLVGKMQEHASNAPDKVKLDVGGQIFTTAKHTLLAHKDSFFFAMLSSGQWSPGSDGAYFIDRDPALFCHVMDYIRGGTYDFLEDLTSLQKRKLEIEFDYYQLPFCSTPLCDTPPLWDTTINNYSIVYDEGGALATRYTGGSKFVSCISSEAVVKFSIKNRATGHIMVGFVSKDEFNPGDSGIYSSQHSYCFYMAHGTLFGMGAPCKAYATAVGTGSVVECIANEQSKTISFSVDGVCKGVAFNNVQTNGLHALCCLRQSSSAVQFC